MATVRRFLNVDGNWGNTANWTGATVPAATEVALLWDGSTVISSGLDQSAVNNLTVSVGPNWTGKVGSSGSNLKTGTGSQLYFNGARCPQFYFEPSGGDATILSTLAVPNSCVLAAGTLSSVGVAAGLGLTLGTSLTLTNLWLEGRDIAALLDSGLTLTNAYVNGGTVTCEAAVTNIYQHDGVWDHQGDTTYNTTLVEIRGPNAIFNWKTAGTFTAVKVFQGLFDASSDPRAKTITNGESHFGAVLNVDNGVDTITTTNNLKKRGGRIIAGPSIGIDREIAEPALG